MSAEVAAQLAILREQDLVRFRSKPNMPVLSRVPMPADYGLEAFPDGQRPTGQVLVFRNGKKILPRLDASSGPQRRGNPAAIWSWHRGE